MIFGASALALGVIALACVQLAQSDFIASRRNWERLGDRYRAESLATLTAWRLMHTDQLAALSWREAFGAQTADIYAEPEARKLGLAGVNELRGQQRLEQRFGASIAARVLPKLVELSNRTDPPSRRDLLGVDDSLEWRSCGLSVVSTYSQLTDDALVATAPIQSANAHDRTGEVWRITVVARRRVVLDQPVRFTGNDAQPVAEIDQLGGAASPVDCVRPSEKEGGA